MEKLLALVTKRREKKANRLVLNVDFWRKAHTFGSTFVMSLADRELSKAEVDLLIELWADLMFVVKNARERTDKDA